MGTSSSSPGPPGRSPLVPPWADPTPEKPLPTPDPRRFQAFRRSLGTFVRTRDKGAMRDALGAYVASGLGGHSAAVRRMGSAAQAGANITSWFASLSAGGSGAEAGLDFASLAGLPAQIAIGKIVDQFCPPPGAPDHDSVRMAMQVAVSACVGDQPLEQQTFDAELAVEVMQAFLTEVVLLRLELDSGDALDKDVDPQAVIQAENDLRAFIGGVVAAQMPEDLIAEGKQLDADGFRGIIDSLIDAVFRGLEQL